MTSKRFRYATVGYGVFSLLGEYYGMGRIEVFDNQEDSGYNIHEGFYCLPSGAIDEFRKLFDGLQTDFPIHIEIGSMKWCSQEVSKELKIPVDKLNDLETKKEFYKKKNEGKINPDSVWLKNKTYTEGDKTNVKPVCTIDKRIIAPPPHQNPKI